jgi:transposase
VLRKPRKFAEERPRERLASDVGLVPDVRTLVMEEVNPEPSAECLDSEGGPRDVVSHVNMRPCQGLRISTISPARKDWRGWAVTDERWAALEPLVEVARPRGVTPLRDLQRTIEAIVRRHGNGARWRAIPAERGPWWRAVQLFIRWSRLGARERLPGLAQERGVELGTVFLDGTSVRVHAKAAGAPKKRRARPNATAARRSAARGAGSAPRRA